jgi:hypothetical protein
VYLPTSPSASSLRDKLAAVGSWTDGLTFAGTIVAAAIDQAPMPAPLGRTRHPYGHGPFAVLRMPMLPAQPGLYVWCSDGVPVYVGQTRAALRSRLGSNGYSRVSSYNTFARQPGRTNGGQQTNCRVNALANIALRDGHELTLWYRVTSALKARIAEADWMSRNGLPPWNRQDRR